MPRINNKKEDYLNNMYSIDDLILKQDPMQVSPYEGKIINCLLKLINARTVIELGLFKGYSTRWIGQALPDDGKVYSFEKNPTSVAYVKEHLRNNELLKKIEFIIGDATQTLLEFNVEVDAFFIDADKASYLLYLEQAKRLLRKGGLLIADNVFLFGNVYDEPFHPSTATKIEIMKEFNLRICRGAEWNSSILPTTEGLLIAQKLI